MANKTQPQKKSVSVFLKNIPDSDMQSFAREVHTIMKDVSNARATLWGESIVGYGTYHYRYDSGREGDFFRIGFSPRKNYFAIYIMPGYEDYSDLLKNIGPYSKGKSCLYIKKYDEIHRPTLKKLIKRGWNDMKKRYPL